MEMIRTLALAMLLSGCATAPVDLASISACVTQTTGYEMPAKAPTIVYSDLWSEPAHGVCCTVSGQTAQSGSMFASYVPFGRTITVYRGASQANLAHEIAADAFVMKTHYYNPQARERVGYLAEEKCGGQ